MSSKTDLKMQQRDWATRAGIPFDADGYLLSVDKNLFQPMSARAYRAISKGSGSELRCTKRRKAKMKALHSSAALHVNLFDHWAERNADLLLRALKLQVEPATIEFETQFPIKNPVARPHVDVVIRYRSGLIVGIESKFSEWLTPISPNKELFKPSYFPNSAELWSDRGMPYCQLLATSLHAGKTHFRYLDAAQLLKHALGLATQHSRSFELYYLYYDYQGPESPIHREEMEKFEREIESDFRFHKYSCQEVFERLYPAVGAEHISYITYLRQRYFPEAETNARTHI